MSHISYKLLHGVYDMELLVLSVKYRRYNLCLVLIGKTSGFGENSDLNS